MLKKIISLVLVMSLLSSICVYSFAGKDTLDASVKGDFKIIEQVLNKDGEIIKRLVNTKEIFTITRKRMTNLLQ